MAAQWGQARSRLQRETVRQRQPLTLEGTLFLFSIFLWTSAPSSASLYQQIHCPSTGHVQTFSTCSLALPPEHRYCTIRSSCLVWTSSLATLLLLSTPSMHLQQVHVGPCFDPVFIPDKQEVPFGQAALKYSHLECPAAEHPSTASVMWPPTWLNLIKSTGSVWHTATGACLTDCLRAELLKMPLSAERKS